MFGKHRNMQDYIRSLEKLEPMASDFDEIWPSHADLPIYPAVIHKLLDGAQKVLNGEVPGAKEEFHGQTITVYNLGFTTLLCNG